MKNLMDEDSSDNPELSYHLFHSSYKDSNSHGCGKRKCPCKGKWVNCPNFVDKKTQEIRIKLKSPTRKNKIIDWYLTYFRFEGEFHNLYSG